MARIAGVDLPREKCVGVALTYIYGIGPTTAKQVLATVGVDETIRVKNLTEAQETAIRSEIDKIKVEGDLRRETNLNVTGRAYLYMVREQRPMHVHVRDHVVQ